MHSSVITPRQFVDKWQYAANLKERSAAQEHFIDLCRLLGHPTPAEADPDGDHFTFEAGATKHSGGEGWADVWKRNFFAWEYKGKHANLDKAYDQLLQYREALLNPWLLIVSDMVTIRIHTNFPNTVKQVYDITQEDLLSTHKRQILHNAFFDPEKLRAPQTPAQVTEKAAAEFGNLADQLRKYGTGVSDDQVSDDRVTNDQIAHFLIRLLFCLFAEDAGLLPAGIFSNLIEQTRGHSRDFQRQLRRLFGEMREGGWFGADRIRYFNGHLFDDNSALELDGDGMRTLARISRLDWSSIEPSIFGTLFERSLDPSKRSQLGAHYTSKDDILLIVEPVLMAPLRRRWDEVQAGAYDLAQKRDEATTPSVTTRRQNELMALLQGFAKEIASVQVLDPACGSGNFLYIALRLLMDLEKEVITLAGQLGCPTFFPTVAPEQLHGIEVNPYAHELAQVTVWIGYLQWRLDNGFGVGSEPVLKPLDAIRRMDAVLAYDEAGRPVEPEWPKADVIIGNPPFLGGKRLRSELGDSYVNDLFALYNQRVPREADLVTYWFDKARAMIVDGRASRVGLLATQAIRAGANQEVLARIKASGDIFYAQADRPWVLDGANVRVSMVGFDGGVESIRLLNVNTGDPAEVALAYATPVHSINADLSSGSDLTQAQRLDSNTNLCFQGPVKVGAFDIEDELAQEMLTLPNPNGRPNSDVIKPWMNASDVVRRPRSMWIIDFDEMEVDEASQYEAPFEYVVTHVKPTRAENRDYQRRTFWWRLGRSGRDLKNSKKDLTRVIITPRVAKHRIFVWAPDELLPDSRLFMFARDDDYFFGVLHSRVHEVWSLATSSRHGVGNDPTYNSSTCFETYPFPWSPSEEMSEDEDPRVAAIAQAARELVEMRDRWLDPGTLPASQLKSRTLTNLYNQNPTWLQNAHRKLDEAVLDAYGWPHDLEDEEILERLLALNLERASRSI